MEESEQTGTLVAVVMVDPGNAEGNSSGKQYPKAVFSSFTEATEYAESLQRRPDGVDFWIGPAWVKVQSVWMNKRHVCREGVLIEALLAVLRAADDPDQPGETQRLADVSQIAVTTLHLFGYE